MRSGLFKSTMVVAAAAALIAAGSGTAQADTSGSPTAASIVGTGSDTTMNVVEDLSNEYNADPSSTFHLYSFDAVPAGSITPKPGCSSITRPNGSSAGVNALIADINDGGTQCLDFARSSSLGSNPNLTWVPFARDAIGIAFGKNTTVTDTEYSIAELRTIYSTNAPNCGTLPFKPLAPQAGSGTRSFWLSVLTLTAFGNCVTDTVQEHDPAPLAADATAGSPFSVGRAIPFANGGGATIKLGNISDGTVTVCQENGQLSATPTCTQVEAVDRQVYNVVRNADLTSDWFAEIFGTFGYVCTTGQGTVVEHGFRETVCGA